jgi:hypothetical protein
MGLQLLCRPKRRMNRRCHHQPTVISRYADSAQDGSGSWLAASVNARMGHSQQGYLQHSV